MNLPAHWPRSGALVALVGAVMTAILGWMVWDRITLLKNGREIVLPVVPVDPRSLFRGDYVILSYDITQAPSPAASGSDLDGRRTTSSRPLFVTLEQGTDGAWKAVATAHTHPGTVPDNKVVLQGRPDQQFWMPRNGGRIRVRYGIESYFVPEGKGLELEKLVRDRKISARIAVDTRGRSTIKGLIVDGKPVYEEPLL